MNNTENDKNEAVVNPQIGGAQAPLQAPIASGELHESRESMLITKTAKLAKLNLFITVSGLGALGYLHFADQGSIDKSLIKNKAAIKQEIVKVVASKEDLENLKNDMTTKVEGLGARVSGLELKDEQYQEEFKNSAQLNTKINELQASLKKSPTPTKGTTSSSKTKPPAKSAKSTKKGKK